MKRELGALFFFAGGVVLANSAFAADQYLCPDTQKYFDTSTACNAACLSPCSSMGAAGTDIGLEVINSWATPDGFSDVTKSLLSDSPLTTLDKSASGPAQVSCPGEKNFLEIMVAPSLANDLDFLHVLVDSDMDGVFDGGLPAGVVSAAEPISGVCSNGVVSCDPGTYKNCNYYLWSYDPATRVIQPVDTTATMLKGCFCFNTSCSPSTFVESKDVILQTIGAGIVNAITSADPSIVASKSEINGPVLRYYGDDLAECSVAPDGTVDGVPLDLSTFGSTNPVAAIKAGFTLDQLAADEVSDQLADSGSLLALLMNSPAMTDAQIDQCEIKQTPWVQTTIIEKYLCPTTGIVYTSEANCKKANCFGNFKVESVSFPFYQDIADEIYIGAVIMGKLLTEGGKCSTLPIPRMGLQIAYPTYTIPVEDGSCSTNLNTMTVGVHPGKGVLNPIYLGWYMPSIHGTAINDYNFAGTSIEVSNISFSNDGSKLYVTARVLNSAFYWEGPNFDFPDLTDVYSFTITNSDYVTVTFNAKIDPSYICELQTTTLKELVEEVQDGCKILEADPDCSIRNETRYDAYNTPIKTVVNGTFTGAAPTETCKVIDNYATLCYDWWKISRDYLCVDAVSLAPNLDRVAAVDSSLASTASGYDYTDSTQDVTYDPATGSFVFSGLDSTNVMFDFLHESAETCQKSCKLVATNDLAQADTAGNTAEYRLDPSSGVVIYRNCTEGVCPTKPGETILTPCSCINEFNQATSIMSILQMTGKDMICSDGVEKTYR